MRVCGSKAEGVGSVPGQGTKIPHSKVEKKKKNKTKLRTKIQRKKM